MNLELIGTRTCPFAQRARIVLEHKRVPYTVTEASPARLETLSPSGKVPLLCVDGRDVVFESSAICEFIDETHPPPLHPADPWRRARDRGWIAFATDLQLGLGRMAFAETEAAFGAACGDLLAQLGRLEAQLGAGPHFDGTAFSLVDAAFAPFWMRLALLQANARLHALDALPRCTAWSRHLLDLPAVRDSVDADFPARFRTRVAASGGYGARRFANGVMPDRAAS
ncbi:MAG: glutathione S-transferase family protein [Gammaproteobacteria bacterium]|nr:glutathione S-transferase family protein [Gammaproteobacteria bacterium]